MWKKWLNQFNGLWGTLAAIVGVFTLGAGAASTFFSTYEEKGESQKQAGVVDRRVTDLNARLDRFSSWAREQLTSIFDRQDRTDERISTEYRAINQRLDQQNVLILEVLKTVKQEKSGDHAEASGWSLIDSAHAATRRRLEN